MKTIILSFLLSFSTLLVNAQEKHRSDTLNIDLDKDFEKDLVIFDKKNAIIIVRLSTQKFNVIKSKQIEFELISSEIRPTKNGFEFSNNWMRAGYSCQFRYNPIQKRIQLIGMSRYEFGPATNDGSGKSSVNLLTNSYLANWNYWDDDKEKLIPMNTIKQKMIFPVTYLEDFNQVNFYKFQDKCVNLYEIAKAKIEKSHQAKN